MQMDNSLRVCKAYKHFHQDPKKYQHCTGCKMCYRKWNSFHQHILQEQIPQDKKNQFDMQYTTLHQHWECMFQRDTRHTLKRRKHQQK